MRHGAWTLARQVAERVEQGERWDGIFSSSMLDLATFYGLAPLEVSRLPAVAYFHENQLTYPARQETERDLHFAFTHLTTGLAARALWFNSDFHRREFLGALKSLLQRVPDFASQEVVGELRDKSSVQHPAIASIPLREPRSPGPLRILWAARWEFDKNPEAFFRALEMLEERQIPFRLNVLGESFREVPEVFARARQRLASRIDRWGFAENRQSYLEALLDSDVFVSTANHEFFGLAAVEAISAGCIPLLPNRLAYPELLAELPEEARSPCLYSGDEGELAARLEDLSASLADGREPLGAAPAEAMKKFQWSVRQEELDEAFELAGLLG